MATSPSISPRPVPANFRKRPKDTRTYRLTPQQRTFVREYAYDVLGNGTRAAIAAGYSKVTAKSQAVALLNTLKIQDAIAKIQVRQLKKLEVVSAAAVQELCRVAFSDLRNLLDDKGKMLPPHLWPDDIAHAVASFECDKAGNVVKLRFWSKPEALAMLGKYTRILTEETPQQVASNRDTVFRIEFVQPKPRRELEAEDAMSHPDPQNAGFSASAELEAGQPGQARVTIKLLPSAPPLRDDPPAGQVIDAKPHESDTLTSATAFKPAESV